MKIWLLIYDYKDWQDRLNMTLHAQAERNSYLLWKIQGSFPPSSASGSVGIQPFLKKCKGLWEWWCTVSGSEIRVRSECHVWVLRFIRHQNSAQYSIRFSSLKYHETRLFKIFVLLYNPTNVIILFGECWTGPCCISTERDSPGVCLTSFEIIWALTFGVKEADIPKISFTWECLDEWLNS